MSCSCQRSGDRSELFAKRTPMPGSEGEERICERNVMSWGQRLCDYMYCPKIMRENEVLKTIERVNKSSSQKDNAACQQRPGCSRQ